MAVFSDVAACRFLWWIFLRACSSILNWGESHFTFSYLIGVVNGDPDIIRNMQFWIISNIFAGFCSSIHRTWSHTLFCFLPVLGTWCSGLFLWHFCRALFWWVSWLSFWAWLFCLLWLLFVLSIVARCQSGRQGVLPLWLQGIKSLTGTGVEPLDFFSGWWNELILILLLRISFSIFFLHLLILF